MKSIFYRLGCRLLLGILLSLSPMAHASPYPFNDDFETGMSAWTATASWGLTTLTSFSPSHSVADSPGGYYANNTDASLEFSSAVDLSAATHPALSFRHRYEFEDGWDFGKVEISTNGGIAWLALSPYTYTGSHPAWVREQLDLDAYASMSNVKIRFRVTTDSSVTFDGWHVDNVRLGEVPPPVTMGVLTNTANTVRLGWTDSTAGDFAAYRICRSADSNVDWRAWWQVAEIDSRSVTNYTDITVCPKTRYYYRVMVITTNDLHRFSNTAWVMTGAGMDFPFLDNAEAGASTWVADPPWAISTDAAASPTHAWTDSPGANYANGLDNRSITLAAPLNLTGAHNPVLSFDHQYAFLANDYGLPEYSINNGVSWVPLTNYTAGVTTNWLRERLSLASCTNSAQALVRFRITTDATGVTNGWFVDNVAVSEAPSLVSSVTLSNVGPHSVCLAWAVSPDTVFDHYAIHRSTNSNVGINSTLVTQITDRASSVLVDTGLQMDTVYYYRVYAVNKHGAYSFDASSPLSARTLIHPIPFADTMEGGMEMWTFSAGWGRDTSVAHSGSACLNDSPGGDYGNSSDGSAQTAVNLNGSTWPVLKFWDRYKLGVGDYAYVEVSSDGVNWTRVYGMTPGGRTGWTEHTVDLSQWKLQSNLRIRFRTMTDGATVDDGWFVDDVSVSEYAVRVLPLPFHDAFESGGLTNNWLDAPGTWMEATGTNAPYEGLQAVQDTLGLMSPGTQLRMVFGGTFNLSGAVDPQWVFWVRNRSQNWSTFSAQVSVNGGVDWTALWALGGNGAPEWKRVQVPLTAYRQAGVRLRFVLSEDGGGVPVCDVALDKVTVEDKPAAVGMVSAVPHLRTMDVTWTPTTLGGQFQRYEVYRSPDATVDLNDIKIATIANPATVTAVDSNLLLNTLYYYGVFTVDTNDVYSPATNEVHGTTWQAAAVAPITNGAETLDAWYTTGTWGLETNNPHGGVSCLNDSPGGDYGNSVDGSAQTAVNLNGTVWPVLKFWDRYKLGAGDYSFVEVSSDGVNWTRVYGLTPGARTGWAEHTVDLSQWKLQPNLRIRFRTMTDGGTVDDGWFVDDVSVGEYAARVLPLPFHDAFEGVGLTNNWMDAPGTWMEATGTNAPYEGLQAVQDTLGLMSPSTQMRLVFGGTFNLSGAVDPQWVFWVRNRSQNWSTLSAQVSVNGGADWTALWAIGGNGAPEWKRVQVPLTAYRQAGVRLRFVLSEDGGGVPVCDVALDKVTVEDKPAAVGMVSAVPHLRTMDVTWTPTTLGGQFQRYEVYRSPDPTITLDDSKIATIANPATVTVVDSNLLLNTLYYYGVFTVDTNDVYSPATNEVHGTTWQAAVVAPMTNDAETLDAWYTTGTWGLETNNPHGGVSCLNDSPGGDYGNSVDGSAQTAVNLNGSTWPVLKFWDRYKLGVGDYAYVEVSSDGVNWTRVYGLTPGGRTGWAEHTVDLSQWKLQSNLRIRFRTMTDGGTVDDGWFVDDVSVSEYATRVLPLPFNDAFESGGLTNNWMDAPGTWIEATGTNAPYEGLQAVQDTLGLMSPSTQMRLVMGGTFNLSGAVDPQWVFWVRNRSQNWSTLSAQVSVNGGADWTALWAIGGNGAPEWKRVQVPLTAYRQAGVRLRFVLSEDGGGVPACDVALDKVTVEDKPAAVGMVSAVPHLRTMDVTWTPTILGGQFQRYEVYRSPDATVDLNDTKIAVLTNAFATSFTDTGLVRGDLYYYGVYLVDNCDAYVVSSNVVVARTLALSGTSYADPMETMDAWNATGIWGVDTNSPASGSACISDSPNGSYSNSVDNYLNTAIDMTGTTWPLLRFKDRHSLGQGDWGQLELYSDTLGWRYVYGITEGVSTNWTEHLIDLSEYKHQQNMRLRFHLASDPSGVDDGWALDELSIVENPVMNEPAPFFDGFEKGLGNWIDQTSVGYGVGTNGAYQGTSAAFLHFNALPPNAQNTLELRRALDLRWTSAPSLTFWMKGAMPAWQLVSAQVSVDGGLTWATVWSAWNVAWGEWTKVQVSLSGYRQPEVRFRFVVGSGGGMPSCDLAIDNVGIGDVAPGAPRLDRPTQLGSTPLLRPVLSVTNAVDAQNDALTYRFEVYSDVALSNLVSQVPVVAAGVDTTSWVVDGDLINHGQYWWRSRAFDGGTNGPWMDAASFYVNQTFTPPSRVVIAGPPPGSILSSTNALLMWYPSSDSDAGDSVMAYQVQVDNTNSFTSPEVNDAAVQVSGAASGSMWTVSKPLGDLAGVMSLSTNTTYFWRVRAQDTRSEYSEWSTGVWWFVYGAPAPIVRGFNSKNDGSMSFEWDRTDKAVYVYFASNLTSSVWQPVAGPLYGTNVFIAPPGNLSSGFYRLGTE